MSDAPVKKLFFVLLFHYNYAGTNTPLRIWGGGGEESKRSKLDSTKRLSTQNPPEGLHENTCPAGLSLLKSAQNSS